MTKSKIHVLSDQVIGKISAGEVVERPASAVKELVENSIDAGADSIRIDIQDAGQSLIRVADNGEGMSDEDVKSACMRHATSKIEDIKDLEDITTMGFRGEALASIAAVSQMEITTYDGSADSAVYLYLEGGEIRKASPAARVRGTTIEVRNLFYNVPARRKFLKREATELAAIMETAGRLILSNPHIEFKLSRGGRDLLYAAREMGILERIRLVMGGDVADHMLEVAAPDGKYRISGYVSRPSNTRKDKGAQMFFVNNRFVRSRLLSGSIQDAYTSLLERGRYPSCVLSLSLAPSGLDVNVHPTKLLVKFDDEKEVRKAVREAVKARFDEIKQGPAMDETSGPADAQEESRKRAVLVEDREVQSEFAYHIPEKTGKAEGAGVVHARGDLFQIDGCYIVRIRENMVTITDQHAAHERILYEYFSKAVENRNVLAQNLLFPVRLDLSAGEAVLMDKLIDKFGLLGFQIDLFGRDSYVVQAAPPVLKDSDIKTVVYDVLSDLASHDLARIDPVEELVKLTSCRAAIKAGDRLNQREMEILLADLDQCDLPFTCPHGRPTSFDITVEEMEKRFRRK